MWERGVSPSPATVLVVEDDDDNREVLVEWLTRNSYRVTTARSGREALDVLEMQHPDLMLLDVLMPDLNGLEVLERVRRMPAHADLPIIMTTGMGESDDVVQALRLGANDHVVKPYDRHVLLARIEAQLRNRASRVVAAAAGMQPVGVGAIIGDRYRIEGTIGAGAFGTVYRACHLGLLKPVALKVMRSDWAANPSWIQRFQREALAASRVNHPSAVTVHDFGVTSSGIAFLAMDLPEGCALDVLLAIRGPLSASTCVTIATPVCDVLAAAHPLGVIHRDLKPGNVFLARTPHGIAVRVLDFGIAKVRDLETENESNLTAGMIMGTPAYMSPERLRGLEIDGSADVYGLGVTLYEMLTGRLPFGDLAAGDPIALALRTVSEAPRPLLELRPEIDGRLAELVHATLAKAAAERPSAAELAVELPAFATESEECVARDLAAWVTEAASSPVMADMSSASATTQLRR